MSVRKKNMEATPQDAMIAEAITKSVNELQTVHAAEIRQNLEESETRKVGVNYNCTIDCSESEPLVTVTINFSSKVTDKRVARLDDPAQIKLFGDAKELKKEIQPELEKSGKTRKKKVTDEIAEQSEA